MKNYLLALSLTSALVAPTMGWSAGEDVATTPSASVVADVAVPANSTDPTVVNEMPTTDVVAVDTPAVAVDTPAVVATPEAVATTEAVVVAEKPAPTIDHGDTAFILVCSLLVLMMTIPGLALFYGGMVRKKNVLSTIMHSFAATALVTVLWVIVGYSLAFGNGSGGLEAYIGGFDRVLMKGVAIDQVWTDAAGTAYTIPEILFMMFQLTFAIITVAIMSGAFAERIKFSAYMLLVAAWILIVYAPICHWVWHAKGWLFSAGALDFAGGTVVHINAGVAGLVAALVIGNRIGFGKEAMAPHNLPLTVIGACLIWVGWFGFNAGSWLAADGRAAMAMVATQVAAAAATLSWLLVERLVRGKASVLGALSGAIAGLVAITPAAGFVDVSGALMIGLIAGGVCFWSTNYLKRMLKIDDSLDAFALHGIGGIVGALLVAFFATEAVTGGAPVVKPVFEQLFIQAEGVLATIIYSGVMTWIIVKVIDVTVGLRVSTDEEREGLDLSQHGERSGD